MKSETSRPMFGLATAAFRVVALLGLSLCVPSRLPAQKPPPANPPAAVVVPDLAAFLSAHPTIASALVCQFPNVTLSYKDWTPAEKTYLRDAFARAIRGEPTGLPDPLPNAFTLRDDEKVRQGLSEQDALQLYFTNVAWSLAFEMHRTFPWSILEYTPDELAVLFDSRQMFQLVARPQGSKDPAVYEINQIVCGDSLPAAPDVSLAFLRRHAIIGEVQLGTVSRLLGWCRGLSHFTGGFETANMRAQWHYDGFPPESRIISGTVYDDGKGKPSNVTMHFTAGCHGTTGFLRSVLRCINIPVENVHVLGHSLPYFPTLEKFLTHGDDPYNMLVRTMQPELVANQLLLEPARFEELFGAKVGAEAVKAHVGIHTRELALEKLPVQLLVYYLEDQKNGKSHADGEVAHEFADFETVPQLEALKLWTRLDARITELGGADKVRALEKQLVDASNNHTPE